MRRKKTPSEMLTCLTPVTLLDQIEKVRASQNVSRSDVVRAAIIAGLPLVEASTWLMSFARAEQPSEEKTS